MTQGLLIGIMRSVRTEPAASNGRTHGSGREGGESLRGHGLGRVHRARRWPWVCHHLYRCLEARRRLLALLASLELRRLLFAQLSVAAWKTDSQLGGSLVDVHRAQLRPPRRHHLLEVAVAEQVVQRPTVCAVSTCWVLSLHRSHLKTVTSFVKQALEGHLKRGEVKG